MSEKQIDLDAMRALATVLRTCNRNSLGLGTAIVCMTNEECVQFADGLDASLDEIEQLRKERDAWNEKFQAESKRHDETIWQLQNQVLETAAIAKERDHLRKATDESNRAFAWLESFFKKFHPQDARIETLRRLNRLTNTALAAQGDKPHDR